MFKDDANVKVKQEFNCAGIPGAFNYINQGSDDVCLQEQSPISNDLPKNQVICLNIESSLADESSPDTSFREVIGTNDSNFLDILFTRINKHGSRCHQGFVNCINTDKCLIPPSTLYHELIQNCPTTTMHAYIHPALLHDTLTSNNNVFLINSRGLPYPKISIWTMRLTRFTRLSGG